MVTHIGSGLAAEMDSALDILMSVASSHTSDLAPFAVFIKVSPSTNQDKLFSSIRCGIQYI